VGLQPLACCDCGFESRARHGYLSFFNCCVLSGRGRCDRLIASPEGHTDCVCVV
jgi:hypothetical protein